VLSGVRHGEPLDPGSAIPFGARKVYTPISSTSSSEGANDDLVLPLDGTS
jgi:hypothetical protein